MKIQIITGSTRPGRLTNRLSSWVAEAARQQTGWEVQAVDLAGHNLPFMNEAISPRYNPSRQPTPEVKQWLDTLAPADGYIIVTPEYNHSIPAVLKNALDYIDFQFAKKPVAIVSHGSVGGARAAEHLKAILLEAKAAVVPEAVAVTARLDSLFDESGQPVDAAALTGYTQMLKSELAELDWWAQTLAAGRAATMKA